MTRFALLSLVLSILLAAAGAPPAVAASAKEGVEPPPDTRDYVCAPRLQLRQPQRCPSYGPGGKLAELAQLGLLSPAPLPAAAIDQSLGYFPFSYAKVGSGPVSFYSSAEDAASGGGGVSSIGKGFVYVSYNDRLERAGSTIYATSNGYVRGSQVSRVEVPRSVGLVFERTPDRPFAWVIAGGTCPSREPGGAPDYSRGPCFTRNTVVQIYGEQQVGEWKWYRIGPDDWIEQRLLAVVNPDPTPPEGVDPQDRWISVNLYEQTVTAYEAGVLKFATAASTGRNGFWTKPGLFQVWAKLERTDMSGGVPGDPNNYYFLQDIPWVLYFDQGRALHGTYWHAKFGTPTSRGCVNLGFADANWIFDFAQEGSWVYIFDPSGNTPTDPSLYGPGGA